MTGCAGQKKGEYIMKRTFGKVATCLMMAGAMLTGCGAEAAGNISAAAEPKVTAEEPVESGKDAEMEYKGDFDKTLIDFVEEQGYADKNYMVSPTSFRAALALAVAGADTETKQQLLTAMGFENVDELNGWYAQVTEIIDEFDKEIEMDKKEFEREREYFSDDAKAPDGKLTMLNSVWNNTDLNGKFSKDYIKYVEKHYSAEASNVNCNNITDKVNKWVNDGTNGLIPSISNDMSKVNAALVNTLYLKSAWVNSFEEYATKKDTFTTAKGDKIQKDFMNQQDDFRFYEDDKGKLVILPLKGGIDAIFVLGEIDDIQEAVKKASKEDTIVKLPKFEVESSFTDNEFIDYLVGRGAVLPFTPEADFSVMCKDKDWMITDIIQKTKIKVDEDGLEAAAATAIMMTEGIWIKEPQEPKEFIADEPFKFYICGGQYDSEMLFCGQVAE